MKTVLPVYRLAYLTLACIALGVWSMANAQTGAVQSSTAPPQRVVSLLPSLTESVCALGQCHRLVGVDRYSNYPASVKRLPQLGGGLDPNIEAIVALRPDVVLMAASSKAHFRLAELGLKVVLLEPKNQADLRLSLHVLGDLFQIAPKHGALKVWQDIEQGVQVAAKAMPISAKGHTVYFEAGSPYAAGEASFVGELLKTLGINNIVPAHMGPFPALNPEFVVKANPSIIMLSSAEQNSLTERPGWQAIRAIREHRICAFNPEDSDMLVRPGPRMVQAAQLIVACLSKRP
jgi:iron complex transport system substrate-binding protein